MDKIAYPSLPPKSRAECDWHYSERQQMQEVLPGVYLGPYAAAKELSYLEDHQISHIVCIRQEAEANHVKPKFQQHFKYLVLNVADLVQENIITHIPTVRNFIDECLRSNGKVLVHGNTGISRSAAFVISYIMEKYGQTYKAALAHVQRQRFCVCPNEGFADQLKEYEMIYQARHLGQTSSPDNRGYLKRKFEDDHHQHDHGRHTEGMDVTSIIHI